MAYFDLDPLLETMLDAAPGISDLNLSVGRPPQVEVDGQLRPVAFAGIERLLPYQTELIAMRLLAGKRDLADKLVRTGSADLSYSLARRTRFRVNVFAQRGSFSIVLRVIPNRVPTVEELGIPTQLNEIANERNGIVLVTGPTGSGKSTTLAAIINKLNRDKAIHIITIEDPIEYLHPHNKATINQREVGSDTGTFALALRAALRQAPKVILVGEMRDVETISIALEASETGHLVLSTLHTIDADQDHRPHRGRLPEERGAAGPHPLRAVLQVDREPAPGAQDRGRAARGLRDPALQLADPRVHPGGRARGQEPDRRHRGRRARGDAELRQRAGAADPDRRCVDREVALSYATNRTNLQLRLDTQSGHRRRSRPRKSGRAGRGTRPAGVRRPRTRVRRARRPDREVERAGPMPPVRAADRHRRRQGPRQAVRGEVPEVPDRRAAAGQGGGAPAA